MLVINYNGNKPTTDYFKFAVQGNNNADVVRFELQKQQGNLDLSGGYTAYVKVYCEDDGFADKVDISNNMSVVENQLELVWTMQAKHTGHRQIQVSLSFENANNEVVWQTQIVKMTISNGLDIAGQMQNTYPDILQVLVNKTNNLHEYEEFVKFIVDELYFDKPTTIIFGGSKEKTSKLGVIRPKEAWGNKKANSIVGATTFQKGTHTMIELLEALCYGVRFYKTSCYRDDDNMNYIYPHLHNPELHESIGYYDTDDCFDLFDITHSHLGKLARMSRASRVKDIDMGACLRVMLKFVCDYEEISKEVGGKTIKYWKGTMSKKWLELQISIYKLDENETQYYIGIRTLSHYF